MKTADPQPLRSSSVRFVARIAGLSLLLHALVLAATPWIEIRLPAAVLAQWNAPPPEDEVVFFLDLRTTAYIAPAPPEVPQLAAGNPEAPVEDEIEPEPAPLSEPAPEAMLETAHVAEPTEAPVELEPVPVVVEPPPDAPPPDLVAEVGTPGATDWPGQLADSAPAVSAGVGRRAGPGVVGAWIVRAAGWAAGAGALLPARPPAPAAGGAPRANHGEDATAFAPRLLDAPKPEYPESCRRRKIEGTVLCRMHVDREGRVTSVDVVESSGDERLDKAASRALARWRFDPPRRAGAKVESKVLHRVSFRLK